MVCHEAPGFDRDVAVVDGVEDEEALVEPLDEATELELLCPFSVAGLGGIVVDRAWIPCDWRTRPDADEWDSA